MHQRVLGVKIRPDGILERGAHSVRRAVIDQRGVARLRYVKARHHIRRQMVDVLMVVVGDHDTRDLFLAQKAQHPRHIAGLAVRLFPADVPIGGKIGEIHAQDVVGGHAKAGVAVERFARAHLFNRRLFFHSAVARVAAAEDHHIHLRARLLRCEHRVARAQDRVIIMRAHDRQHLVLAKAGEQHADVLGNSLCVGIAVSKFHKYTS